MSHIPASAMPHAKPHHDDDKIASSDSAGTILPDDADHDAEPSDHKNGPSFPNPADFPLAALAIGGLMVVGAIAAVVVPMLGGDQPKSKKKKAKGTKTKRSADA